MTAEAIEWHQRLEADSSDAIEDQFAEWVRRSPHHLPCYLKQAQIEAAMRHIRAQRAERGGRADHADQADHFTQPAARDRWKPVASAAILFILIAVPVTIFWAWHMAPLTTHLTNAVAEVVTLPDGSSAKLNPDSLLTAKDLAGFSEITLINGGAQFQVHHRDWPESEWQRFRVFAGSAVITATGTAFNVLRTDERTGVYVVEGGVKVEGRAPTSNVVPTNHAGERPVD